MTSPLQIDRRDAVIELTLNRPERRNALSDDLIRRLAEAIGEAEADASVRVLMLTGAPPAFCSGVDLREVVNSAESEEGAVAYDTSALLYLCEVIDGLSKPVIAAVNGPAVASGAMLVCLADIAIFARSAVIGYPGVRHGLVAPVVMHYLLRLVRERVARYLLLTGHMLEADQALVHGLATEVVPDANVLNRAREHAVTLVGIPVDAIAESKVLLRRLRALDGPGAGVELRRLSASVPVTDAARVRVHGFLRA